jgi:two-component system sensor histidine kinase FlrB
MSGQSTNQNAGKLEHLESAFQTFNQLSEQLITSYHLLEGQVEQLNRELSIARDERLEQFDETKRLANRLEHLLNALPGGVVVLDGKGIVREINPAAIDLLGEPLKGIPWRNVIQRAFAPRFDDGHEVSLRDGRRVSIATSSLGNEPGQILLIKDISETRELQEKLSRYQRLSAMGQMAASLAHQIRTPTAAALLYLSALHRHNSTPETVGKYADKIRDQLRHIEAMISDMLAYVKGGAEAQESLFLVDALIKQLSEAVHSQAQLKGAELRFVNQLQQQRIKGNQDALLGALINLVMNALNADAPLIEVEFSRHDERTMQITVRDNGSGIPAAIKARIFEPFVTTRPQGTGLGLAVVKSVIEKFGGEITFSTQPGNGTEFRIILPLLMAANDSPEQNLKEEEVCP